MGRVRVTLDKSPAGSLLPDEGSHSINPTSIACHLFLPNCLPSAPSHRGTKKKERGRGLTCPRYPFEYTYNSHTSRLLSS